MIKTILDIGQAFSNKEKGEFNDELKYTIKYLKKKVDDYKPVIDTVKNIYQMFKRWINWMIYRWRLWI